MGWKGTLRSINAASNRIDRHNARVQKANEKHQRQVAKERAIEDAAQAIAAHKEYLEEIVSYHKFASEQIEWQQVFNEAEPIEPTNKNSHYLEAKDKLENYKPNFFIKIFSLTNWRIRKLTHNVETGRQRDDSNYQADLNLYKEYNADWLARKNFAELMLSKDTKAYAEIFDEQKPFDNMKGFGGDLNFSFNSDVISVNIELDRNLKLPTEVGTLLKSGKLSVKEMPKAEYNQLYQDNICSFALRVVREVFALTVVDKVVINVMSELLNPVTGQLEWQPILSIMAPRETMGKINFSSIDPSEAMKNFTHNMDFKKADGMRPVKKVA